MMSAVSAAATRASKSDFGRWCAKAVTFFDCAIPIALVAVIIVCTVSIAGGFIH
jgi:hypothetical protein